MIFLPKSQYEYRRRGLLNTLRALRKLPAITPLQADERDCRININQQKLAMLRREYYGPLQEFRALEDELAAARSIYSCIEWVQRLHQDQEDEVEAARTVLNAAEKRLLAAKIDYYAKNGKVAVIENGTDCDGVRYWGRKHVIDANVQAYDKLYDCTAKWADGPFHFTLDYPDARVEYGSHDTRMEAWENGEL